MTILVTGGAGYLGSHVVKALAAAGERVVVLDDLLYTPRYFPPDRVEFVRGRVETTRLDALCFKHEVTAVVWLAAIVGDAPCMVDPSTSLRVNTEAVRWLASFGGRVVFPSSCSVYGVQGGLADEDAPLNPVSLYAMSKIAAEKHLEKHPQAWVLRLGTLHGASDRMRFDLMVNAMTLDAVERGEVRVFGGAQSRPLAHVKDVACLMARIALGESLAPPGTYNVASENLTALAVGKIVSDTCGAELKVETVPFEDRRDYSASCDRIVATGEWDLDSCTGIHKSSAEMRDLLLSGQLRDPREAHYYNALALKGGKSG